MNAEQAQEPPSKRTRHCGHCNRDLSIYSYRVHLQRYYDDSTKTWRQDDAVPANNIRPFVPTLTREMVFNEAHYTAMQPNSMGPTLHDDNGDDPAEVQATVRDGDEEYDDIPIVHDEPSGFTEADGEQDSDGDDTAHTSSDIPQDESLPYEQERILRAYSLFILFLQFQYSLSSACVNSLLKATHTFLSNIANSSRTGDSLKGLAAQFPCSMHRLKSWLKFPEKRFCEYAVCPTCGWVYKSETCKQSKDAPFLCNNKQFPNHPQQARSQVCGTPLTKVTRTSEGRTRVKLLRTLCYNPISEQLAHILQRFHTELKPRPFQDRDDILFDVQDGPVHKSRLAMLQSTGNEGICLVLALNIDWFQPYRHTPYSVGAIYISINNLPRHIRYHMENMLLVAVIPGPKEPAKMDSVLSLVVDELKELRLGLNLDGIFVRAALSCMACDIPAARKTGGFASHSSTYGCTRCLKVFPHSSAMNKVDSSGYDMDSWQARTDADVIKSGIDYQMARTKAQKQQIVRLTGVKYSPIQTLEYFSPTKDIIIDPMHNLFLGVAKTVLHTWKEQKLLTDNHCSSIQSTVNSILVPRDIGRIPLKIASGFSSLTADQLRLWTILYSSISLETLPQEHRDCWDLFVRACTAFCSKAISGSLCDYAREHMVSFCDRFQALYGNAACVPNMHFSCHLDQCLRDHGPAHSFWLFPFERMNGLLADTFTNSQDISVQFMRHFVQKCTTVDLLHSLPADLKQAFFPSGFTSSTKKISGGVLHSCDASATTQARLPLQLGNIPTTNVIDELTSEKVPVSMIQPKHVYLTTSAIHSINHLISMLTSLPPPTINIYRSAQKAMKCTCGDTLYVASCSGGGDTIYGRGWNERGRKSETCAGQLQQFFSISFNTEGKQASLIIAEVSWYEFTGSTSVPFPWQEVIVPGERAETLPMVPYLPVACILSRAAKIERAGCYAIAPVDFIVHDSILSKLM